ncbi:hypothetical protein BBK36DRAFT_1139262 [Trichoderma citrinoviride]|uniref:Uncharacterized protein n=1 Tax=Trichoderma citrinoviride TaxID=58853 RepID=A0A2T4BIN5_9HYPO|nr:hypothetical protein BBK36DRAFT_1139262 [Trichoderma citrinoviride]PTB69182.1 hypothetical protein BBK36DRAFT_1139262 [Trichoderma citrinoviride]
MTIKLASSAAVEASSRWKYKYFVAIEPSRLGPTPAAVVHAHLLLLRMPANSRLMRSRSRDRPLYSRFPAPLRRLDGLVAEPDDFEVPRHAEDSSVGRKTGVSRLGQQPTPDQTNDARAAGERSRRRTLGRAVHSYKYMGKAIPGRRGCHDLARSHPRDSQDERNPVQAQALDKIARWLNGFMSVPCQQWQITADSPRALGVALPTWNRWRSRRSPLAKEILVQQMTFGRAESTSMRKRLSASSRYHHY